MHDMYRVRQFVSIVLFDVDNVLNGVYVALNISSVLRVELGGKVKQ
jgi:hypothetical protein